MCNECNIRCGHSLLNRVKIQTINQLGFQVLCEDFGELHISMAFFGCSLDQVFAYIHFILLHYNKFVKNISLQVFSIIRSVGLVLLAYMRSYS